MAARSDNTLPRRTPETWDIPGLGKVQVGRISFGDTHRVAEEADKVIADNPDEYANRIFAHIVLEPPLTVEAASKLGEPAAAKLVELAAARLACGKELHSVSTDLPARGRLNQ